MLWQMNLKLIIFDLDQTLVEVISIHDAAARQLFQKYFGVKASFTEVEYAGRSMPENFVQMGKQYGISPEAVEARMTELLSDYDQIFRKKIPADARKYILPGAAALLAALVKTDNVLVLYTGDSRPVAESILKSVGLAARFRKTFHATEVPTRADMVQQAIDWAQDETGNKFVDKNVVIVGDSMRDIECGHLFNARSIAVATGAYDIKQLKEQRPDYFFSDLSDYRTVMKAILE
jgi:phosphoglycolate phosphatase